MGYENTELSHVVQERAEGPKAPSPGQRPGYKQGALTGRQVCDNKKPRAMPWARSFCPFQGVWGKLE